ncbi:lysophospholipid acyltransferase family protein [Marinicella sp. S1101]|uniref:lysophospholipid acyltransferase family protein n=1 Tax=Marinicella marina TaxID=2996016 RepID=UPI002260B686|nr:lysophospholipid acyltransferase family protein [Marinicella marina]MCX7552575.1 lysophospholipid acyltransferase family protein [Marinicella marina]MDJ1139451.1 lysophospholipid acyltransferase family protein [Marinicella marina]
MRAFLFQFIIWFSSKLSLKTAHKWAAFMSRLVWRWSEKQRRITTTNIKCCYPKLSEEEQQQLAQAGLTETIKSMLELGVIWRKYAGRIDDLIVDFHGLEVLEQALAQQQGLLLAVPHFGNWEVLNLWLSRYDGFSFLYKPPDDKKIEQQLLKNRGQGGANQITANAKGVRQVFKVLKQNHILAILPDQQPKNGQGVFSPFMGQSAYTMTLFSKIAMKTKTPVIFAVAERLADGKGFDLHFKVASPEIYGELEASVNSMNQSIAEMVRINPSQYQWTYRRFSIQADDSRPYRAED